MSQIAFLVYRPGTQSEGGHRSKEIKTRKGMLNLSYLYWGSINTKHHRNREWVLNQLKHLSNEGSGARYVTHGLNNSPYWEHLATISKATLVFQCVQGGCTWRWRVTRKEIWLTLLSVDVFPLHSLNLSICRWEITVPILQKCFGNELICIVCSEDKKSYFAFGLDNKNLWKQWLLHRGIFFLSNVGLWDGWYLYAAHLSKF